MEKDTNVAEDVEMTMTTTKGGAKTPKATSGRGIKGKRTAPKDDDDDDNDEEKPEKKRTKTEEKQEPPTEPKEEEEAATADAEVPATSRRGLRRRSGKTSANEDAEEISLESPQLASDQKEEVKPTETLAESQPQPQQHQQPQPRRKAAVRTAAATAALLIGTDSGKESSEAESLASPSLPAQPPPSSAPVAKSASSSRRRTPTTTETEMDPGKAETTGGGQEGGGKPSKEKSAAAAAQPSSGKNESKRKTPSASAVAAAALAAAQREEEMAAAAAAKGSRVASAPAIVVRGGGGGGVEVAEEVGVPNQDLASVIHLGDNDILRGDFSHDPLPKEYQDAFRLPTVCPMHCGLEQTRIQTKVLSHLLVHSLVPLTPITRLLVPHYLIRSRDPLRSLCSLPRSWDSD